MFFKIKSAVNFMHKKSLIRWAGSKRKLIPRLISYWNLKYSRYIEPFAGSACLFFAIQPKKAVISDLNEELINTFLTIRDHPRATYNRLIKIPQGSESYYHLRNLDVRKLDTFDRAARFIFLNRFCFNGLYRTDNHGNFNVPFSPSKTGGLPKLDDLSEASKILLNAKIISCDFENILLKEVKKGDFVYLDPPYAVSNRRIFRQYGPQTFGLHDIERLRQILNVIESRGASFVLSYAQCKEASSAFKMWSSKRVFTQRNIAGFASNRKRAAEEL